MTVLIDTPLWPAHGRLWAHLVSDSSLGELHAFAAANGIPARGFDLDHYDVPEDMHDQLVAAGAVYVSGGELVRRLIGSGLRVPARDRLPGRVRASRVQVTTHVATNATISATRITSRVSATVASATVPSGALSK